MTKKELEDLESILIDADESDDVIEILERLHRHILLLYRSQCKKKLGHNPAV